MRSHPPGPANGPPALTPTRPPPIRGSSSSGRRSGDSDAFAQIYNRYLDPVFRFIYFRVTNRQVAEDLTAETFLRALKRIGSVTWQGRDIGAWLITIARNLVADHFKSGRYRFELPTGDVLDADAEERGPEGSPGARGGRSHHQRRAARRPSSSSTQSSVSASCCASCRGLSVAETAQAMGKNEGAIKALQYRAVRALHRLLPEGFQGDAAGEQHHGRTTRRDLAPGFGRYSGQQA